MIHYVHYSCLYLHFTMYKRLRDSLRKKNSQIWGSCRANRPPPSLLSTSLVGRYRGLFDICRSRHNFLLHILVFSCGLNPPLQLLLLVVLYIIIESLSYPDWKSSLSCFNHQAKHNSDWKYKLEQNLLSVCVKVISWNTRSSGVTTWSPNRRSKTTGSNKRTSLAKASSLTKNTQTTNK